MANSAANLLVQLSDLHAVDLCKSSSSSLNDGRIQLKGPHLQGDEGGERRRKAPPPSPAQSPPSQGLI